MLKKSKKGTPAKPRRQNISASSYDPETGQLYVTFHNGRRYRYDAVSSDLAAEFEGAQSRGGFLHKHIIGKCKGCEIFD